MLLINRLKWREFVLHKVNLFELYVEDSDPKLLEYSLPLSETQSSFKLLHFSDDFVSKDMKASIDMYKQYVTKAKTYGNKEITVLKDDHIQSKDSYWLKNEASIKNVLPPIPVFSILDLPDELPTPFMVIDGSAVISSEVNDVDVKIYGISSEIVKWQADHAPPLYSNKIATQYVLNPHSLKKIDVRIEHFLDKDILHFQAFLTTSMIDHVEELQTAKELLKNKQVYGAEPAFGLLNGVALMAMLLRVPKKPQIIQHIVKSLNTTITIERNEAHFVDTNDGLAIMLQKKSQLDEMKRVSHLRANGISFTLSPETINSHTFSINLDATHHHAISFGLRYIEQLFRDNNEFVTEEYLYWTSRKDYMGNRGIYYYVSPNRLFPNIKFRVDQNLSNPLKRTKVIELSSKLFQAEIKGMLPTRESDDSFTLTLFGHIVNKDVFTQLVVACFDRKFKPIFYIKSG